MTFHQEVRWQPRNGGILAIHDTSLRCVKIALEGITLPARIKPVARVVKAVHGIAEVNPDFELGLSKFLSRNNNHKELLNLYQRFAAEGIRSLL